jgi:Gpi18-like mannosyltransferase
MTGRKHLVILAALFLTGLGVRVWLCSLAPRWAYFEDHFDNVAMGAAASRYGLLRIYSVPKEGNPEVAGRRYDEGRGEFRAHRRRMPRVANYPPLGVTMFWIGTRLLAAVDPSVTANTFASRAVMGLPVFAFEILLAVGVYLLARQLVGRAAALAAGGVCWLFPPLVLDSAFWGQTDVWPLAPGVFAILLMLRRRWIAAGLLLALACLLKPQGLLLAPVALFGALLVPAPQGALTAGRYAARVAKMLLAAAALAAIVTLPWTLADGLHWLDEGYLANFGRYPHTTLMAFNIWYSNGLGPAAEQSPNNLDDRATILGIAKRTWGVALALMAMTVLAWFCWQRYRRRPALGLVLFAGLWLWTAFMWPTQVHERYIAYCMPLLIVGTVVRRRLWPAALVLCAVGVAEMTHPLWVKVEPGWYGRYVRAYEASIRATPPGRRPGPEDVDAHLAGMWTAIDRERQKSRRWEYLITLASILGYGYGCVSAFSDQGLAALRERAGKGGRDAEADESVQVEDAAGDGPTV